MSTDPPVADGAVIEPGKNTEKRGARIRLWLVHVINHRHLNDRGQYTKTGDLDRYPFKTETEARTRRDALLEQFPYAYVYLGGDSSDNVERMSSPQWGDYSAERQDFMDWRARSWFLRLFCRRPRLSIYDPAADPLSQHRRPIESSARPTAES